MIGLRVLQRFGFRQRRGRQGLTTLGLLLALFTSAVGHAADSFGGNGAADWLAQQEEEFLKVDQAFRFSARQGDDGALLAEWSMPPGYYLYRHAFDFQLRDASAGRLGTPEIPPGKAKFDEYFGDVEVYYDDARARVAVFANEPTGFAAPANLELGVTYQGCADAGLCYPPELKWVPVTLAAGMGAGGVQPAAGAGDSAAAAAVASAPAPALPASASATTEEQRLAAVLGEASVWWSLALFLLGGIGLAFTPCVLPMVPILSSIIVGEADELTRARAFRLSLAYVLGMAITYAVLGVLVGSFGASLNLQAALQSPAVLVTFALVFVALSLSMFGFYELRLPQGLNNALAGLSQGRAGGRFASVFVMGSLSSLVVSPCVSAPLAGALIYISTTGDAIYGGLALLALGLGMGVPLLILGASGGHLLPKAGVWMDSVKAVFGVGLLGVAIWLLERVVPGAVTLALWAALAIGVGVYLGALDFSPRQGWGQLWKASGALSFTYGVLLLIGAASGAQDPLQPLQNVRGNSAMLAATTDGAPAQGGDWVTVVGEEAFEREWAAAVRAGRPALLDLYADWCISCKVMERRVFPEPEVSRQLAEFHLIKADVTRNTASDQALMERFGLYGPPSMVFFDRHGEPVSGYTVQGEMDAPAMAAHLGRVLTKTQSSSVNVALK